jgi:hypothetical protein
VIVPFPPTFFENQTVKSALQAIPVLVQIYLAVELFPTPKKKQKNGAVTTANDYWMTLRKV